jgi:hypothetical protein
LWWPYENAAILSDRPSEIHVNDAQMPHREDGPAIVFRDGWQLFAWNGKAVPERWIMQTESVPAGEYRGFDPSFVQWAKSRAGRAGGGKKRAKPASIAKALLPSDHSARLEHLRAHAGGRLPLHDRYVGGEHREVWRELLALGPEVRSDPHAADALAVAYETMHRVEGNVRTLVERLTAMGYVFATHGAGQGRGGVVSQISSLLGSLLKGSANVSSSGRGANASAQHGAGAAHVPPAPTAPEDVARFEKEFGVLPLSLRAFYEVVGEVNLMGRHPTLDPPDNRIAPDPLVVHGLDEGLVMDEDDDEESRTIIIAPDDLHKANTSGGDPYAMMIPDPRADGELLDERHRLFFVDYLRLCFEFGGFPGYEGKATAPRELRALSEGLVAF